MRPSRVDPEVIKELDALIKKFDLEHRPYVQPTVPKWKQVEHTVSFLQSIQHKISLLGPADRSKRPPLEQRLEKFAQWYDSQVPGETFTSHCLLQAVDGLGAGVTARHSFAPQQLFLSVPRSVMITEDLVAKSEFGRFLASLNDPFLKVLPTHWIALYLIHERHAGVESRFEHYINALPRSFTLPLFMQPHQLRAISHHPVALEIANLQYSLLKQFVYFQPKLDSHLRLEYPEWLWAISTMMTRQNYVHRDDGSPMLALVPGFDFCNHDSSIHQINSAYNPETNCLDTYTDLISPTAEGQPLCIYYGDRSNSQMLMYSGFIEPESMHKRYQMPLVRPSTGKEAAPEAWEKIKSLMLTKASVDRKSASVNLPLPMNAAETTAYIAKAKASLESRKRRRAESAATIPDTSAEDEQAIIEDMDRDFEDRMQILTRQNLGRMHSLFSFLRIEALQDKDEAMVALKAQEKQSSIQFLSTTNETRALQLLHDRIQDEIDELSLNVPSTSRSAFAADEVEDEMSRKRVELVFALNSESLALLKDAQQQVQTWKSQIQ